MWRKILDWLKSLFLLDPSRKWNDLDEWEADLQKRIEAMKPDPVNVKVHSFVGVSEDPQQAVHLANEEWVSFEAFASCRIFDVIKALHYGKGEWVCFVTLKYIEMSPEDDRAA